MSVKLWNTSSARAAGKACSIASPLSRLPFTIASAAISVKVGRTRLPPEASVYSIGSYNPRGSFCQFKASIALLMSIIINLFLSAGLPAVCILSTKWSINEVVFDYIRQHIFDIKSCGANLLRNKTRRRHARRGVHFQQVNL